MKQIYLLALTVIFFTSCNGQVKESPAKEEATTNKVQAKLPRARGSFQNVSVGCALQDKAGNFWFGTNGEGLFLYDGKTFTNFTDKEGLDNHFVYSLLEDKTGNIWIGTKTALFRYDVSHGESDTGSQHVRRLTKVSLFPNGLQNFLSHTTSKRTQSPINGVWSMMQDKKGIIWFGADDGVYCYDGTSFTFFLDNNIINKDSLHLRSIFSFLEDKKGNIWFGSCIGEGLIRFDVSLDDGAGLEKSLKRISPKGYTRTQSLVEDGNGNIWFASIGKGMCRYNARRNDSAGLGNIITTNFFKEKDTYDLLYIILKDKRNRLWFSEPVNNKVVRYYDGNELINFAERNNLPDNKMYPVLEDHDGNIWFAAYGMKLYRWNGKTFSDFSE